MQVDGTLKSWNDERGFGFIAPTGGHADVFVHISAFPNDGSRPTVGERLSFELGRGSNGKPQAVQVFRKALGQPALQLEAMAAKPSAARPSAGDRHTTPRQTTRARHHQPPPTPRTAPLFKLLVVALLVVLGVSGYVKYQNRTNKLADLSNRRSTEASQPATPPTNLFRCDGRTHCSQMTSCAEATYFLKNCPVTQMDGDGDGTPCEQQWCTSPFAK